MPLDRGFAEALVHAMERAGWHTQLPDGPLPNPLPIRFSGRGENTFLVYARRMTPQSSEVSDHGRPEGELHTQMLFDGDQRGKGARNRLRFEEGTQTILLGFYHLPDGDYVAAAYDPERHREYGYSTSLQVKEWKVAEAAANGIAFQTRQNDEVVVIFRINEIASYLEFAHDFHTLTPAIIHEAETDQTSPPTVRHAFKQWLDTDELPSLEAGERRQRFIEAARYIRNHQFRQGILSVYRRCATCGFQYDYILDAAHIVPVADGGTDTYDNGLGLCPNCHRMFDKGLILVDADHKIYVNPRYAEEYDQMGIAGSLELLRQTLLESLWLPDDPQYYPSPDNLRRTFNARR